MEEEDNEKKIWTYDELMILTEEELEEVKQQKIADLNIIRNRKLILAGNIMSLQNQIRLDTKAVQDE